MDNQTKESRDQKFRQWAESIQQTKDKHQGKTGERSEDQTSAPQKTEAPVERPSAPTRPAPSVSEKEISEEKDWDDWDDREDWGDDSEDREEREESKYREDRKRRRKPDVEVMAPRPRKKGKTAALITVIAFLLVVAVVVCLVLVNGRKKQENLVYEVSEIEPAADQLSDTVDDQGTDFTADMGTEAQTSGISLSVPDEYALYGRTEYNSMTQEEYDQLLSGVHQFIDVQLKAFTKLKDPYYPHFDAVSANDDCTVYMITVNEAGNRSKKEIAVPEQLSFFTRMYAAYSQQDIQQFEIDYQTSNGTVLKKETISLAAAVPDMAVPAATVPGIANNSSEIQGQPGAPLSN